MAERARRTLEREQTRHFVVYDRQTGRVLSVHHLTALPGVQAPSDAVILRRLRSCTKDALSRSAAELNVLSTRAAPVISPRLHVDIATGKVRAAGHPSRVAEGPEGDTPPAAPERP